MGAHEEPGRRAPMEAEERRRRGHGAARARRVEAHRAEHADDGSRRCASIRRTKRSRAAFSSIRSSSRTRSRAPGSSSRIATWVRACATSVPKCRTKSCIWQDPIPKVNHKLIGDTEIAASQEKAHPRSKLSVAELVSTAWASASTYRGSDMRGGANGARIRLAPMKDWEVNEPAKLAKVLRKARSHSGRASTRRRRTARRCRSPISSCSAGTSASSRPRRRPASRSRCRSAPGRMDASQEQTDVDSFKALEPVADGFRNYLKGKYSHPVGSAAARSRAAADADRAAS